MFTVGAPLSSTLTVPATSRATVDLQRIAGAGRDVFTVVSADQPVGAEETVYRDGKDFSSALGVGAPQKTWYLAEGYTGQTFHESIKIFNPGMAPAHAVLRLLPFNGRPATTVSEQIAARSGLVIDANAVVRGQSLSATVDSDQPVVVDRLLTFGPDGYGATEQTATGTPANTWLFAEGSSANGFETFFTILNPSTSRRATVTATFYDQKGAVLGHQSVLIDAHRRGNIRLNDVLHASGVATILTGDSPIVAERPMYFGPPNGSGPSGGSDVFGRNGGGTRWLFPEGDTAGNAREFLLFENPTTNQAPVTVSFFTATGRAVPFTLLLPPRSRTTLDVLRTVSALPAGQHAALVTSINAVPIVVEQSIYHNGFSAGDGTEGIAQ
jgi:hypothetical protein